MKLLKFLILVAAFPFKLAGLIFGLIFASFMSGMYLADYLAEFLDREV